jgi:plasmid stabilization system protein ParE
MTGRKIIWTPEADTDVAQILFYLDENWDNKVALRFLDKLDGLLFQIEKNPFQFPIFFKSQKIRKCVVTMQNSLFYQFDEYNIFILRIYDTRQNPQTLKLTF